MPTRKKAYTRNCLTFSEGEEKKISPVFDTRRVSWTIFPQEPFRPSIAIPVRSLAYVVSAMTSTERGARQQSVIVTLTTPDTSMLVGNRYIGQTSTKAILRNHDSGTRSITIPIVHSSPRPWEATAHSRVPFRAPLVPISVRPSNLLWEIPCRRVEWTTIIRSRISVQDFPLSKDSRMRSECFDLPL